MENNIVTVESNEVAMYRLRRSFKVPKIIAIERSCCVNQIIIRYVILIHSKIQKMFL